MTITNKNLPDKHGSYKRTAFIGMIWTTASVTIVKLSSFVSQIVLGWFLSKEDFALYAIAISMSSIVWTIRNGGVYKVLVQKGQQYNTLADGFFKIALLFNLLILAILLATAPVLADIYMAPKLPTLIWIIALSTAFGTPAMILRAKLSIDMKFSDLARIDSVSAIIRYGSMIVFALLGFEAMSFVLPLILVVLYEWAATWKIVRAWPISTTRIWPLFKRIIHDTRWVMLGSLAIAISLQGDYMIIGLFEEKADLGVYFFAFQLTIAFSVLFTSGIDSVMLPSLAILSREPARQAEAFIKALRVLTFVVAPISIISILIIDPVIQILWSGKWNEAIIIAQLMLLTLVGRLPLSLSLTNLEARGSWRFRTLLQITDSILLLLAVFVGAWTGDLVSIAIWSSSYRLLGGLAFSAIAAFFAGQSAATVLRTIASTAIPAIAAGIISYAFIDTLVIPGSPIVKGAATILVFAVFFVTIVMLFSRERLYEAIVIFGRTGRNTSK